MLLRFPILIAFAILLDKAEDVTIRTSVPLVVFSCSITDRRGKPIRGLTASDIQLLDGADAKQVKVDTIDSGLAPIALVVVIQKNDRAGSALGKIRKVGALVGNTLTGDGGEAAVLTFNSDISLVQDFTGESSKVSKAIAGVTLTDNDPSRMIDAVSRAVDMLARRHGPERRIILIVGESRDHGSKGKLQDLVEAVQRTGTTIYCLKYSAYITPFTTRAEEYVPPSGTPLTALLDLFLMGKESTMKALAVVTGGIVQDFETKGKLEGDLMRVSSDLHNRYQISFLPDKTHAAGFHAISLHVIHDPEAIVHAPPGYLSLGENDSVPAK